MTRLTFYAALFTLGAIALPWAPAQAASTEIVSLNSVGVQGNTSSWRTGGVSDDGRYVVFESGATNLVDINGDGIIDGDANGTKIDVFVHDRDTGTTEIVSVNSAGVQAAFAQSRYAHISGDGRYVTFSSQAFNLVDIDGDGMIDPDANGFGWDVFVHDRVTGTTEIVSVNTGGEQANSSSFRSTISPDGRYVVFISFATNLVDSDDDGVFNDDTNGSIGDVFVHDRISGTTDIVSINSEGFQGNSTATRTPAISADGRYIAFQSRATNLVDIDGDGTIDLDANGTLIDAFVHDRDTGKTEIVHVNSAGEQGNNEVRSEPNISRDGRYVAFSTRANNLVDINGDGTIDTDANGFNWDAFVHDRVTGTTKIVSVNSLGVQGNRATIDAHISGDGLLVTFWSSATNLVDIDGDGVMDRDVTGPTQDVYVHDLVTGTTEIVSVNDAGAQGNNTNLNSIPSANGKFIVFSSHSDNLVDSDGDGVFNDDTNGVSLDIFLRVRGIGPANQEPTADAGPDQTVEATSGAGASVNLDGSGSSDDDGDVLAYSWTGPFGAASGVNPSVIVPLGSHIIGLEVDDGTETDSDVVTVTVQDTTPPDVTSPAGVTVEATGPSTPVNLGTATASDVVDGALSPTASPSGPFTVDTHVVTWSATDAAGNTGTALQSVTVVDMTPPVVTPPANITIEATGPTTAVVLGTASALDLVDGALPATPDETGPFPIGTTPVHWSATDAAGNTGTATQNVTLVYIFGQFLPPLEDGKTYKANRTLPVKFQITFMEGELVEDATVGIEVVSLGEDDTLGEPIDLSTNETADTGSVFRFTDDQYNYNLSTKGFEPGMYRITAILSNGQAPFIDIGLR